MKMVDAIAKNLLSKGWKRLSGIEPTRYGEVFEWVVPGTDLKFTMMDAVHWQMSRDEKEGR